MRSVTIRAFAKINLSLRVGDVRADGYHPVQTLLQGIDLFDTVRIVRRPGPFEIRCETKGVPLDRANLVWQAADVLWQTTGRAGEPRDVLVTLRKGIPMQAGLGGGSSDAAAASLWRPRPVNRNSALDSRRTGGGVEAAATGAAEAAASLVDTCSSLRSASRSSRRSVIV